MSNNEKLGTKHESQHNTKESFLSKFIRFFNKNQNTVYGVVIAILVVICGIFAFNKFYLTPKTEKAEAAIMHPISLYLSTDTTAWQVALDGDDENDGFLTIADDYKLTKTANTANYYAGLTYLKMGQKEEALEYLKKFKQKENVLYYACQALIGDLYDEQGATKEAIAYYQKAIKSSDIYFTPITLFKLAQIAEREENWSEALKYYQQIEKNFEVEYNKMSIDRYVARTQQKAGK
ncbi:MAG: tetratricopeptide repeat protein [Bacteroidales bacterium]|jgi:tetratricopeptide (TPR) repeat protein|nr:tetratricopeptide repeat protein [Bacteroidales bacterium]